MVMAGNFKGTHGHALCHPHKHLQCIWVIVVTGVITWQWVFKILFQEQLSLLKLLDPFTLEDRNKKATVNKTELSI